MKYIEKDLKEADELVYKLLEHEQKRQEGKLLLNAATSITPKSIREIQGSLFDNIDAEGYIPDYMQEETLEDLEDINKQLELYSKYKDDRFNKCCEYANVVEALAQKRLAKVFTNENTNKIYVNVQVPTGAIANYVVYKALLKRNDTILSLGVNDGGHTTHGDIEHESSEEYNIINYHISLEKNDIDYEEIGKLLAEHKPQLLIAGASSFPLNIDWKKIRKLINENSKDTLFMADIAHTAGLVAGKVFNNPVGIADVTTLVTYKTFCGPRAAAIIITDLKLAKRIDETVFPKIMGSPLLLGIAGIAVASNIALTEEYQNMQKKIVENSRTLCKELMNLEVPVVYGKTDSHIVLLDCSEYGTGKEIANILEDCNMLVNSCLVPSAKGYHEGIRIGTTCITQCSITEEEIKIIANLIADILKSVKNKEAVKYEEIRKKVDGLMKGVFVYGHF